ncbi:CoA transferase [Actinosynnema sp. NPDC020468]|uniref:CoA transferase n=1 Tax=Actinosynnema sp. NPDC020468 TaxID=3154488 RepID=UPI0033DD7A6F
MGDDATDRAWAALGGTNATVSYVGAGDVLPATLPVRELARATVGVCSLAAARLLAARNGGPVPEVVVREDRVATAFVSERHLRVAGRAPTVFAPLSGFWRAADGWVRTHANYPHHRDRLLGALGVPESRDAVAAAIGERSAVDVQEAVYAAGGLAVAVTPDTPRLPLVERSTSAVGRPALGPGALPASGVRVLDLTRVIAGPVATRTLALLGADVLRVDSPALPEFPDAHADTGGGKRSTLLDLRADGAVFSELLASADVLITGYRPGALPVGEGVAERFPGLVVAELNAWGWTGPWAGRRGFDSLVQAANGIALREGSPAAPGVLPAQALDHGTGYLLAAAVLRALGEREGGGAHLRLSLAGTASWLVHDLTATSPGAGEYDVERCVTTTGVLRHALSPVHYAGAPEHWTRPPGAWGADTPTWL